MSLNGGFSLLEHRIDGGTVRFRNIRPGRERKPFAARRCEARQQTCGQLVDSVGRGAVKKGVIRNANIRLAIAITVLAGRGIGTTIIPDPDPTAALFLCDPVPATDSFHQNSASAVYLSFSQGRRRRMFRLHDHSPSSVRLPGTADLG